MSYGSTSPAPAPRPSAAARVSHHRVSQGIRRRPRRDLELLLADLGACRLLLVGPFSPAEAQRAQDPWALVRRFVVPTLRDVTTEAFKA
jgi:hypothetical protein